ncbi:MAG TPA: FHA domain-containing serine/threonine-protein kinase [Ktedonobacterales bacterium]
MVDLDGQSLGQYKILQKIGQGGMARVYRGYQAALERDVAIKVIPAHIQQNTDKVFLERFVAEARTVAKLSHPYIVPIHDFGVDERWAYLVMEYITGGSVRDHLAAADKLGQRLSLPWTLMILEQAAQALDFAHQRGVVHRDVKPGNMLLRNPQLLLLSDFGVAKMLQDRTREQAGEPQVVGTPQYMAPEQCRADGALDGRSDIYAMGVVLFQCVTGRLPFYSDTPEGVMLKHMQEPPPHPSIIATLVPPSVERIILTAMAKDPARRYQRAADMAAEMHAVRAELENAHAAGPGHKRAGPTMPVSVAAARSQAPVVSHHGLPGAPGTCFRCGSANSPANRHCVVCGYDMAAHRMDNDRFLATNGRPLRCRLVFRTGPFANLAFTLHQDVTTIGRGLGNDVLLQVETVSRQHARLTFMGGQWVVEDVNSQNGVWVNETRVRRPLALAHGDLVRFGEVQAIYELMS